MSSKGIIGTCEHGIDNDQECTACHAVKDLLLPFPERHNLEHFIDSLSKEESDFIQAIVDERDKLKEQLDFTRTVRKGDLIIMSNLKQKLEKFEAYNFELQRWTGNDFEWAFTQVKDKFKEILEGKE